MRRVIDLECVLPPDENGVARQYFGAAGHRIGEGDPELLPALPGYGFENYRNIFTRREGRASQPDAKPGARQRSQCEPGGDAAAGEFRAHLCCSSCYLAGTATRSTHFLPR